MAVREKENEMSHVTASGDEGERTRGITCKGFCGVRGKGYEEPGQGRAGPGQARPTGNEEEGEKRHPTQT